MADTRDIQELGSIQSADVYKGKVLAAHLTRTSDGVRFEYLPEYIGSGFSPIAHALPKVEKPQITAAGGVPAFFAGLLPEGRRLQMLQQAIKTSLDDELSFLLAVGKNTIGDVRIIPHGEPPTFSEPLLEVRQSFEEVQFSGFINDFAKIDRVAIPGVQEKVSAQRLSLPASRAGSKFILKLESPQHPFIIENEDYFLKVARRSLKNVVQTELVHDSAGQLGLLVTRFDRILDALGNQISLAVEDACQIMNRWPADKYNITSEALVHNVSEVCSSKKLAIRELFRQFCFAWFTGNGDLHAKNISVLSSPDGEWKVAPAYDLPCTLPYDRDPSLALTIGGKKTGHSRRSLIDFGTNVGLSEKLAKKVIDETLQSTEQIVEELRSGALPFNQQIITQITSELRHRRRTASTQSST